MNRKKAVIVVGLLSVFGGVVYWLKKQGDKTSKAVNNFSQSIGSIELANASTDELAAIAPAAQSTGSTSGARGIRNNNPGNIRRSGDPWKGLALIQTDSAFFQFTEPKWGIRAMARIITNYQARGTVTVEQIISTWAPSVENNTRSYINFVSKQTGWPSFYKPDKSKGDYLPLIKAIIHHENGEQPYSDALIEEAIGLS